jgi:tRNA pseudouridine55 synthase
MAGRFTNWPAKGIEVEREPRAVTIHAIDCLDFSGDTLTLRVACSKGTYIRVLAADIGQALGCGAHLASPCGEHRGRRYSIWQGASRWPIWRGSTKPGGWRVCCRSMPCSVPCRTSTVEGEAKLSASAMATRSHCRRSAGKIRVYADGRLIGVGEPGNGWYAVAEKAGATG